jgi:hypothetical protein
LSMTDILEMDPQALRARIIPIARFHSLVGKA